MNLTFDQIIVATHEGILDVSEARALLGIGVSTEAPGPELAPGEIESLAANPAYVAPLPVQQVIPPQPPPQFQTSQRINPQCPEHRASKFVPAGTSKSSGKAYKAFWGCTERSCKWTQDAA